MGWGKQEPFLSLDAGKQGLVPLLAPQASLPAQSWRLGASQVSRMMSPLPWRMWLLSASGFQNTTLTQLCSRGSLCRCLGPDPNPYGEKMEEAPSPDPQLEHTRMAILAFQPTSEIVLWLDVKNTAPGANSDGSGQGCSPGFESPTPTFNR